MLDQLDGPFAADVARISRLPEGRGRPAQEVRFSNARPILEVDLPDLLNPVADLTPQAEGLVKIRSRHHHLARQIAEGKTYTAISEASGMSISRISILTNDPAFAELIAHYRDAVTERYLDVHEKIATLAISATEELQARLDDEPDGFTNKELMNLAEVTLDRSIAPSKAAGGVVPSAPVAINISFVQPNQETPGRTINITPDENKP